MVLKPKEVEKVEIKQEIVSKQIEARVQPQIQVVSKPTNARDLAHQITVRHFGEGQWSSMDRLIMKESGYKSQWNKAGSGACGIPQALPCSKLPQGINTPVEGQLEWMAKYIRNRYGNPSNALAFHNKNNWY